MSEPAPSERSRKIYALMRALDVDYSIAAALYDAGYLTPGRLSAASVSELMRAGLPLYEAQTIKLKFMQAPGTSQIEKTPETAHYAAPSRVSKSVSAGASHLKYADAPYIEPRYVYREPKRISERAQPAPQLAPENGDGVLHPNESREPTPRMTSDTQKKIRAGERETSAKTKRKLRINALKGLSALFIILAFLGIVLPVAQGSMHIMVFLSESMEPAIGKGSIVVSTAIAPEDVREGDIIAYSINGKLMAHRVVGILPQNDTILFKTKGDAYDAPDLSFSSADDLVGKVSLVIPYLGYLPYYAKTPLGITLLVLIPVSLLVINEGANFVQKRKQKMR